MEKCIYLRITLKMLKFIGVYKYFILPFLRPNFYKMAINKKMLKTYPIIKNMQYD